MLTEYNEYPRSIFKEQLMETGHPRPRTPSYSVLSAGFSEALEEISSASANASAISKYRLRSKNTTIRSLLIMTALPARLLQCMPVDRPVMF